MKLSALIIDDEPLAHGVILEYVKETPFIEIVGQCHRATEAIPLLNQQEIDLLFLDIQMPKLKGLDFLKSLQHKPLVIITSAYQEYALESFELDVCDYLLKPFRFDRFLKAVMKAQELYQLKNNQPEPVGEDNKQFFIKVDKRHVQLCYEDLHFLESYGNYVKVWVDDKFHLTPRTLSSFEEQVPEQHFIRVHKSFIVNTQQVDYLEGNQVFMKNKKAVPLGKNHRQAFKQLINGE